MMIILLARIAAPKNQPLAIEWQREDSPMFVRGWFRGGVGFEVEPRDLFLGIERELQVEQTPLEMSGENHSRGRSAGRIQLLNVAKLLFEIFEKSGRFIQRQRGLHFFAEEAIDCGIVARIQ